MMEFLVMQIPDCSQNSLYVPNVCMKTSFRIFLAHVFPSTEETTFHIGVKQVSVLLLCIILQTRIDVNSLQTEQNTSGLRFLLIISWT
jgi:hypothetical protein